MNELEYKNYTIRTRQARQWIALVWRPGSPRFMIKRGAASIEEGETVAVTRAKVIIDEIEAVKLRRRHGELPLVAPVATSRQQAHQALPES